MLNSGIASGTASNIYPYARLSDASGNPLSIIRNFSEPFLKTREAQGFLDWRYKPLSELGIDDNTNKSADVRLDLGAKLQILKELSLDGSYQYFTSNGKNRELRNENSYFVRDIINRYSVLTSGVVRRNFPLGAILTATDNQNIGQSGRLQLNFTKQFNKHSINALGGYEVRETSTNVNSNTLLGYNPSNGVYATMLNLDSLYAVQPSGTARIPISSYIRGTLYRYRSIFANASYAYNSKYIFSLSARIDQSNLFGYKANQKSTPLWSAGVKWKISDEKFYPFGWLPSLAIRATYGYNANLSRTSTPLTLISYLNNFNIAGTPYASTTQPGNPELTWERIGMKNFGLDFSTKNGNLSGSFEYYHKNGTNMIGDDAIDPTTGFTFVNGNFSDMKASGFDLTINSKNLNKVVGWLTSFQFSYATNEVVKYKGTSALSRILEGRPVASIYSLPFAGLDPSNGDPLGIINGSVSKDYVRLNSLTLKDRHFEGSAVPEIFGSILNSFSYKKINLSFNITYKFGYYFVKPTIDYSQLFPSRRGHLDYLKRWQKPGDETITNIPSLTYPVNTSRQSFFLASDANIESGNHIRLEDVRIGYDLSKKMRKQGTASLSLFAYANNLGVIWKATKADVDPNNFDALFLPPRTISIGLRFNLN